jgi:AraC-like DNA-binding protein
MKRFFHSLGLDQIPSDSIVIGDDLALVNFNNRIPVYAAHEPYKLKHAAICICTAGHCSIKVNLQHYEIESPMLVTLMPGQIVEGIDYSPNFDGITIVLSKHFIDMLNLPGWQQQYMTLFNNPVNTISVDALRHLEIFYTILHKAASDEENPFRLQVIENLIRVFYYGGVSKFRKFESSVTPIKNSIVERFMELVQEHYREERLIGFYADKLCITPKYLSKLVKENTGRSAGEWIDSHVILEARAMLQSSDMTIQQIAASLNFPNQSFFGKYFKRATGLSPKQYRSSKETTNE